MFEIGEVVVYKREVCIIKELKNNFYRDMDYYILNSIIDDSLVLQVPVENKMGYLRKIMSKEEVEALINRIPDIEYIDTNEKFIENEYKALLQTNEIDDLVKIIKTTYLRNDTRQKEGKKTADKDSFFFNKAETFLYTEISKSLNMPYDEVKNYIIERLK
mgnify:CR=1 FL=1